MSWEDRIIAVFLILLGTSLLAILAAMVVQAWKLALAA